ncbi:MAG: hypothetical protein AAFN30_03160 [Actinomycetota bacterium]
MQAVLETTDLDTGSHEAPDLDRPVDPADASAAPVLGLGEAPARPAGRAEPPSPSFGHQVLLSLPASLLVVFVAATVGLAFFTDTIWAAAGFGAYLAFWLGGGSGFLIAGIRWGLSLEAADHGAGSVRTP